MNDDWSALRAAIIRFVLVVLCFALLVGIVMFDILVLHNNIPEVSATEIAQEVLLALSAFAFFTLALQIPEKKGFLMLVAGFFGCMLVRELDALFDYISHGFWVYPALLMALGSMFYARSYRGTVLGPLVGFTRTTQFNTICYGLAIVLAFSRLFGMSELWHGVMGEHYLRIVKDVAEEAIELLGDGFIFTGAVSYYLVTITERQKRLASLLALRV